MADGPRRQIILRPLKVRDLWNALAGHQEPAVESPLVGPTQSNHLRVLIAEDNLINQKVVLRMLERLGFRADLAADGAAAVAAAERTSYDLILMDMQMPRLDGLEATREIRRRPLAVQPYIVALTASATEDDRKRCLDAGMDDHVAKPVHLLALRNTLERYSNKNEASRSLA